jgi:tRNA A37 threonylcarbamoyladenosine synthetase subunit TsaC/SUA5/YrdC
MTPEVINKINQIKQRPTEKSYSIIAPSLEWIPHYFAVPNPFTSERTKRVTQFPTRGLTLLLPLRDNRPRDIDFSLVSTTNIVGVRLLRHSFQEEVYRL